MSVIGGALISAGGSLLGGLLGQKSNADANRKNAELQREFAQNGIRWKMEDAKKAGIHPLAALGATGQSASPSYVGDNSMPQALSNMGQDVGRAVQATRTQEERLITEMQIKSARLDIDGKEIDNAIRASQLQKMRAGVGPSLPSNSGLPQMLLDGQGDSYPKSSANSYVIEKPAERTHSAPGHPGQQAGHISDVGWATDDNGTLYPIPSKDVKEQIEDQFIPETAWAVRNYGQMNAGTGVRPPKHLLPKGAMEWRWSTMKQGFEPIYRHQWLRDQWKGEKASKGMLQRRRGSWGFRKGG